MKEKFEIKPLIEVVQKPNFSDTHGLREYLVTILDESQKRNKLNPCGVFNNKGRNKSLLLGWKEGGFFKKLTIEEAKNKKSILIGVEWQCSDTKEKTMIEKFNIYGMKPEDPIEDTLQFYYKDYSKNENDFRLLDINQSRAGIRRIKGWLLRAVEFNCL